MEQPHTTIKTIPKADRPRQKLLDRKAQALTNTELLSLLIGTGTSRRNALELAADLFNICHQNLIELGTLSVADLLRIPGIGPAKAATISAAIELFRRHQSEHSLERHFIRNSKESAAYIRPLIADQAVEVFGVLYLVQAGWLRSFEIVHTGGITSTTVDLRVIFKRAWKKVPSASLSPTTIHPAACTRAKQTRWSRPNSTRPRKSWISNCWTT